MASLKQTLLWSWIAASSVAIPTAALSAETIKIASGAPTTTLDPMRSASNGNIETFGLLYARLLRLNAETSKLEPSLAESWEASGDGKAYTFRLRDAKFSDGTPITAEDVVFSLERVRTSKESAYPAPLAAIESISASDPKTVIVKLKHPFGPMLSNLEIWNMGVVSKKDVDSRGDKAFADVPVTSGPYKVKQWLPNEKLILEPNANYWRKGYPKSDSTVELVEVKADETRIAMLKAKEVHAVRGVPWSRIDAVKADPSIDMRLEPSTVIYVSLMNTRREPFSNVKARQAAAMAIDNKALTKAITFGYARPANTTLPDALTFHDTSYPGNAYDPAKAKALLQESGMAGKEVTILTTTSAEREQMALLIQAQWSAIGLKPKIQRVDPGAFWDALTKGDFDTTPTWWFNETTDPDLAVRWTLCGTCGPNSYETYYSNKEINNLTDAAARELDVEKRAELYKRIERITTAEVSQIPLYYAPYANAYSKRLKGLRMTPALQWTLEETEFQN
jgi:peptide/nickel transport system substrate-binding protein